MHKVQDMSSVEAAIAEDAPTPMTIVSERDSDYGSQRSNKRQRLSVVSQNEDRPDEDVKKELKRLRLDFVEFKHMWENQQRTFENQQRMLESQRAETSEIRQQLRQILSTQQQRSWRPDVSG